MEMVVGVLKHVRVATAVIMYVKHPRLMVNCVKVTLNAKVENV